MAQEPVLDLRLSCGESDKLPPGVIGRVATIAKDPIDHS